MKVLTIGGATQDHYLRTEGADTMNIEREHGELSYLLLKAGAKIEVNEILSLIGGGATNAGVSFARLGNEVATFCKIADDVAGQAVKEVLVQENVDTSLLVTTTQHPTGISYVIHSRDGERVIFVHRGANGHLQTQELPLDAIANSEQVYVTSMSHESGALLPVIASHAKKNNVPVAINPGSSQLMTGAVALKEALKDVDIFILNSDEANRFMYSLICAQESYRDVLSSNEAICKPGSEPRLLAQPATYENCLLNMPCFFREILNCGPRIVVVTDGCHGVYAAHEGKVYYHPAVETEVVDTLGAGDAFGSCFVASLAKGYSIGEALRNGNINSSSVISQFGAKPGLLNFDEIEKRAADVPPAKLQVFEL